MSIQAIASDVAAIVTPPKAATHMAAIGAIIGAWLGYMPDLAALGALVYYLVSTWFLFRDRRGK